MSTSAPPPELNIRIVQRPDRLELRLEGELDLESAPELDRAVDGAVEDGAVDLVIDLSGIAFMDSSGLAALVRATRVAEAAGGDVHLSRPAPQVQRLFELTGTLDAFSFES